MNFELDAGKLLYALGVLFAAAAIAYFVPDAVFRLSITVKAVLLFLAFVGFFVAGLRFDREIFTVIAFLLSGVSYLVFLGYAVSRYDLGQTGIFLSLAASAALFIGLGVAVREREVDVSHRTAVYAVGGLAVVGLLFVGADVLDEGTTTETTLEDSVTLTAEVGTYVGDDELTYEGRVGTVTATNDGVFRRPFDRPAVAGCLVGLENDSRIQAHVEYEIYVGIDGNLGGSGRSTHPIRTAVDAPANRSMPETLRVERGTDCRASREQPTLLVAVGEELDRRR